MIKRFRNETKVEISFHFIYNYVLRAFVDDVGKLINYNTVMSGKYTLSEQTKKVRNCYYEILEK